MFLVTSLRALQGSLSLLAGLALVGFSSAALNAQVNTPTAADGFDPNIDGAVFALATQADGKILVGGTFTTVNGAARGNLARLNIDGTVDASFTASTNGKVTSIAVQADGRIVVGGYFSTIGAATRNGIARLDSNGSVDAGFNPNLSGFIAPGVEALVIQPDGRIIAGGAFTTVQPNGASSSTTRNRLARFNADGSLDATFNPNADRVVLSIALQSDGRIIVGGGFTTLQPNGAANATTRNSLARLNSDGSLDVTYDPNANNGVTKVLVQPDGKVVAGGYFTAVAPNGAGGYTTMNHLARFNVDGSLDTGFNPNVSGNVLALALQNNGGILVGGSFAAVQSVARANAARLNSDGSLDVGFNPNPNFTVSAMIELSDGDIIFGGNFTQLQPNFATAATTRNHIARVNPDGTVEADFNPDTNGRVLAIQLQADGKALVGGSFTSIGGVTRNYLARLNTDGSLDTSFDPNFNGQVTALAIQGDGRILVGGSFTTVKGVARQKMARLNADGTLDPSFEPNPDNQVNAITVQSDGKILIGGYFLSVRPNGSAVSTVRNRLGRLNSDGSLDNAFDPVAGGPVFAIKLQSDGKILVGGNFLGFASGNRANIARLNADGTLDPNYNPSADRQVNAIVVQSDGKVVIGGSFTFLQPTNAPVVTTTTTNADGTVTKSQTTTSFRRGIARLNTDGTVDATFDPSTDNVVRTLVLQPDQKIIAGGLFKTLAPNTGTEVARTYIARINPTGTLDTSFDLGVGERIGNQVIALAVQADNKIILGGAFNTLQPAGQAQVVRNQIARVNSDGTIDAGYAPNTGGPTGAVINSLTTQADGRVLVGGAFSAFGGTTSANLARFNTESIPDQQFNPDANGTVNTVATRLNGGAQGTQLSNFAWLNSSGTLLSSFIPAPTTRISGQVSAIAVQPDGKILLAGTIADASGATGGNLIRLNANGSLDTTFNPQPDGAVNSILVQPDGRIVLGGAFLNVGGVPRQYVARVNADGTLDTAFNPTANGIVYAMALQTNGYIILGGAFTTIQPNGATSNTPINYLARVKDDGSYDNTFNPNPNSTVYSLALQNDGGLIFGGAFTTVLAASGSTTVLNRNHVARIRPDTTTDTTFDPSVSGNVLAIAIQPDGKIVLGGNFSFLQANGSPTIITRNSLARVNADGSLDASFDPNPNGPVIALGLQPDGKIVIGGLFTTLQPAGTAVATARARLARVNSDGTLDGTFDPNPNGSISAISVRPDGTIMIGGIFSSIEPAGSMLVGGAFTSIGGINVSNLALLTSGGSASGNFTPNPNGPVYAFAVRSDNRVIAGGTFTTIAGVSRTGVAQLNADGTIDSSFNAGASATGGPVVLLLQPDGKVLVGGTSVGFAGSAHGTLERLNSDGSLDASFNPSGLGAVNALALQSDGKILVGGAAPGQLVRLNPDGTTDSAFAPAANGPVNAIAVQSDGRIVVGGSFTSIGGAAVPNLARLLSANGAADPTFTPNVNGPVTAVLITADGKVLFGGSFTAVGALPRYGLARVGTTSPALQTITTDAGLTTITWTRTGSGPVISDAVFERSSDGRTWTTLGQAAHVGTTDTWQLAGQNLSGISPLFIRARGTVVTSRFSSNGIIEAIRLITTTSTQTTSPQIVSTTSASGTSGSGFYYSILTNLTGATFGATGLPSGLTVDPSSGIISGTTLSTGTFPITLTATNSSGTATAVLTLVMSAPSGGATAVRFVNLSSRAQVTATDPLIAGLVINGSAARTVLLRAVGPGLAPYGVAGIAHPRMQLFSSANVLLNENSGWGDSAALTGVFNQVGAFPFTAGSADAAMLVTLQPGRYSVVVSDTAGASGIALVEVYDTGTDASSSAPRLVNISSRATASAGVNTLIGGFVITGSANKRVLIRGVGPALGSFGVGSAMADPVLNLYDANSVLLAQNDNWGTPVTITAGQPAATSGELSVAATQAGGFALSAGSADSAIIVNLPPGTYSAQVKSVSNATGTALVEIYELP